MADDMHELVAKLVADPAAPPDLTLLNGYLGRSTDDACIRLYRSPTLNVWQDIPTDQIKHRLTIDPNPSCPLGELLVWMSREDARNLKVGTSVAGASRPVQGAGQTRPGGSPGSVVTINIDGGGRPSSPSGEGNGGNSGGGYGGTVVLYPPKS